MPDLEYVRDEIRDRILIEQRRQKYGKLLASLRSKNIVELYMEGADTISSMKE
jgi:hypothetical protein